MGLDPRVPPLVLRAPGTRVQMERAKVQRVDVKVRSEVEALAELVGVAAVAAAEAEALVAQRHHVVGVEALDVGRGRLRPGG